MYVLSPKKKKSNYDWMTTIVNKLPLTHSCAKWVPPLPLNIQFEILGN